VDYTSNPIIEDLKKTGTITSKKKTVLDGRWLTAKLKSNEVILLAKVKQAYDENYGERATTSFKISLKGKSTSLQSGSSGPSLKSKEVAKQAEWPLTLATETEQSPARSEPVHLPPWQG
jgi:hypothetical protein